MKLYSPISDKLTLSPLGEKPNIKNILSPPREKLTFSPNGEKLTCSPHGENLHIKNTLSPPSEKLTFSPPSELGKIVKNTIQLHSFKVEETSLSLMSFYQFDVLLLI